MEISYCTDGGDKWIINKLLANVKLSFHHFSLAKGFKAEKQTFSVL